MSSFKNFTFFVESIRLGNGGIESLIELSQVIENQSGNVNIIVPYYNPFHKRDVIALQKKFNYKRNINILYVPGIFSRFTNNKWSLFHKIKLATNSNAIELLKNSIKILMEHLFFINDHKIQVFTKTLEKSNYVIDGIRLNPSEINYIKNNIIGEIVLNHPGAPSTFMDFWLDQNKKTTKSNKETLYKTFIQRYDKVIFQNTAHSKTCSELIGETEKIITLHPTCNENEIDNKDTNNNLLNEGVLNLVSVGTIQPRKAQHLLVEIMKELDSLGITSCIHILGKIKDKNYFIKLKQAIHSASLPDRIKIYGHVDNHLEFLKNADLLIHTSLSEGFPRVFREAMYARLMIASFHFDGINSVLGSDCGIIVKYGEVEELANRIKDVVYDETVKSEIVENSYKLYLKKYSRKNYKRKILETFFENTCY